jgi:hypothetical protein
VPIERLQQILGEVGSSSATSVSSPTEAQIWAPEDPVGSIVQLLVKDAARLNVTSPRTDGDASDCDGVLVVCGSGYLMSQVREALGVDEPK